MSRRERKSKGSLSVLDEFTSETGAGEITYSPPAPKEVLARIEKATKLADVPISMRLSDSYDGNSLVETDNKQVTKHKPKWRQTEDKTNLLKSENKQPTIGLQLDHKQTTDQSTIGLQLDHKQTTEDILKNELVYKRSTEQTTDQSTIGLQLDHKQTTKWHISSLYGHERNFLFFVFLRCKNSGALVTDPISNSQLRESLNIRSSSTIKTVIDRVIKKGFLTKKPGKTGRGGWMIFEIQKATFQDLLLGEMDYKQSTIGLQTDYKQSTKQTTEQTTSPLGSKVDNINNNYLTTTDDWNFEMLHNIERFGITSSVLKRAREISPNLQIDQASLVIEKFSVRMESDAGRSIKNPIGYFLSLTKKAASGEDILPEIETESDRLMREMVEKAQDVLKKRAEIEAELLESSFLVWMGGLDSAKKREIAPNSTLVKEGSHPYTQHFKNYYKENLWPKEKEIMLQGKV